jgi:hypothetical protein
MNRRLLLVAAFALGTIRLALAAETPSTPLVAPAQRALAARQKMMQFDATAADVDAFLALATDGLVYEDPVVKMKIEGKNRSARDSSRSSVRLGKRRSP